MNHRQLALMILAGTSLAAGTAIAADIYRYVDDEGNVNYVDRPSGAKTEERLAIASNRSSGNPTQARADTAEGGESGKAQAAEDSAKPRKKTRAERRAEDRKRDQECQGYRDQMETLTSSRRLYREDENGERVYLDESESQAARDRVQELIQEFCR